MKYLFLLSLVTISIFAFSSGRYTPALIVNHDKVAHALIFFVLSFLMHRSFLIMPITKMMGLMILLGIVIELIQFLFISRGFSLEDLMHDGIGVILYASAYKSVKAICFFFGHHQERG